MERGGARDAGGRDVVATIGTGITITGQVAAAGELQVDGRIVGDVRCATLFLGETGAIEGSVEAERVRVSGAVDGAIVAGDLAIEASGRVRGEVTYARLKVSAGAVIEASLHHRAGEGGGEGAEPAALKLVETPAAPAAPRRVYGD